MRVMSTERLLWRAWFCASVVGTCGWRPERRRGPPNTPLQPTASRARSLAFWQAFPALAAAKRQPVVPSAWLGYRPCACETEVHLWLPIIGFTSRQRAQAVIRWRLSDAKRISLQTMVETKPA